MPTQIRFTKKSLEALPPAASGRRATYHDAKTPGLQLRVTDNGVKTFVLRRRVGTKQAERVTLGRFPDLTVEQAREMADGYRPAMLKGQSVNAAKRAERARALTFGEALEDYVKARRDSGKIKPATEASYLALVHVNGNLSPWRDRALLAITRDNVQRLHQRISDRSPAGANLAMRVARAVFNYAAGRYEDEAGAPIIATNPISRLSATKSWNRIERRRGFIRPHELGVWMSAVQELGKAPEREPGEGRKRPKLRNGDIARDLLMLLLLTGLRRNEAFTLRWQDVCFESNTLTVQDTKNREPHTLPLSDYLVSMLKARQKASGREYVFSDSAGTRFWNPRYALARVKERSGTDFTFHDLRRTFATVAESLDVPAYAVKALLNHKSGGDVTAGYIQITPDRLRGPMQKITDFMLKHGGLREPNAIADLRGASYG